VIRRREERSSEFDERPVHRPERACELASETEHPHKPVRVTEEMALQLGRAYNLHRLFAPGDGCWIFGVALLVDELL
jgi:hypothetical protein